MEARDAYEKGHATRTRELEALESRSRAVATARLALAAGALGILAGIVWGRLGVQAWAGLVGVVAAFVVLVVVHARIHDARERASSGLRFHDRGLARLGHAWDKLAASSERFRSPDHPFTGDFNRKWNNYP